jgi:hypothetical protein
MHCARDKVQWYRLTLRCMGYTYYSVLNRMLVSFVSNATHMRHLLRRMMPTINGDFLPPPPSYLAMADTVRTVLSENPRRLRTC